MLYVKLFVIIYNKMQLIHNVMKFSIKLTLNI